MKRKFICLGFITSLIMLFAVFFGTPVCADEIENETTPIEETSEVVETPTESEDDGALIDKDADKVIADILANLTDEDIKAIASMFTNNEMVQNLILGVYVEFGIIGVLVLLAIVCFAVIFYLVYKHKKENEKSSAEKDEILEAMDKLIKTGFENINNNINVIVENQNSEDEKKALERANKITEAIKGVGFNKEV